MWSTNNPFRPSSDRRELPPVAPLPSVAQTLACKLRPFEYVEKCRARYGDSFAMRPTDFPPLVFVSSPQDIREIATRSPDVLHAGGGGALMAPVFGERAFMLHDHDQHASVRDAIMPAFHPRAVLRHAETIAEIVDREVGSWPVGEACSFGPYLDRLTLLVMLRIAITDREPACQRSAYEKGYRGPVAEIPVHGQSLYELLCQRMLDMLSVMATPLLQEPRLRRLPGWRATWRRFLYHRQLVHELVYLLIATRRGERVLDDRSPRDASFSIGHRIWREDREPDLLDLLIAARNPDGSALSDRQVRDNLISVIVAGHETTAATLGWAFQLLAHNPVIQDRLIEEIDGGSSETYMNATIQEALRHRPTFLFLPPRVVVQPTEIGRWSYRPPTQLLACTYLLHHDARLYDKPDAFLPERFLREVPQPGTLLPWGLGRKRCPGRQLALIEIREVLRRALSDHLVLSTSARIERPHWRTALLAPHAGSKVILCSRKSPCPGLSRARVFSN